MNTAIQNNLKALAEDTKSTLIKGEWRAIRVSLDFVSEESVNVGVLFQEDDTRHFRLMNNAKPVAKIFGPAAEDELRFLLSVTQSCLENNYPSFPAQNITLGEPKFAAGNSPEEIVDRLYQSVVTLARRPDPKRHARHLTPLNNTWIRSRSLSEVRKKLGLSARDFAPEDEAYLATVNSHQVALDLPLRAKDRVGSVISSAFFQKETIELNYLRAVTDIHTGRSIFGATKSSLFIFYPEDEKFWPSKDKKQQAGNVIDLYDWRLKRQGIATCVSGNEHDLTDQILAFAPDSVPRHS